MTYFTYSYGHVLIVCENCGRCPARNHKPLIAAQLRWFNALTGEWEHAKPDPGVLKILHCADCP